jgi:enoyl-CoA hydratase/carnithine racemase
LLDDIDAAFDAAERDDDVRVVVLSGNGPSFCSGYDLKGSYYITPPEGGWTVANGLERLRGIEDRYRRISDFPKPTIARVHGHALATGRVVDGREAERIGLVSAAVPAEELDATVEAIAADCAAVPAGGPAPSEGDAQHRPGDHGRRRPLPLSRPDERARPSQGQLSVRHDREDSSDRRRP